MYGILHTSYLLSNIRRNYGVVLGSARAGKKKKKFPKISHNLAELIWGRCYEHAII